MTEIKNIQNMPIASELAKLEQTFSITPQTSKMLEILKKNDVAITKATQNFNKTQSQFMDNMLTVAHPTPIRNLRQILAEMKKSKQAIAEATYNVQKLGIEIEQLQRKINQEKDDLELQLLNLEQVKKQYDIMQIRDNITGAIRKLTNYQMQFDSIKNEHGIEDFNELDFEEEEEKYHIKKSFQQALAAARSRGGTVDQGNLEYFQQIGINPSLAQYYIQVYLMQERNAIIEFDTKGGPMPTIELELQFLEDVYNKFKGSASDLAKSKGMQLISSEALIRS